MESKPPLVLKPAHRLRKGDNIRIAGGGSRQLIRVRKVTAYRGYDPYSAIEILWHDTDGRVIMLVFEDNRLVSMAV